MWANERGLRDYLHGRLKAAQAELASLDADYVLSENEDVLVTALLEKHMPKSLAVDWEAVTRSEISEVTTRVRDQFELDRVFTVPASKVVL